MLTLFDPAANYLHQRFKLFWIDCKTLPISDVISDLDYLDFPTLNMGREVSPFIQDRINSNYLYLEAQEYVKKIIYEKAHTWREGKTPSVALYNLGILFEPSIRLDPSLILKKISKETGIVILWDAEVDKNEIFHWGDRSKEYCLNFKDTNIHKIDLQNEVQ